MRMTRNGRSVLVVSLGLIGLGLVAGMRGALLIGVFGLVSLAAAWLLVAEVPQLIVSRSVTPNEVERGAPAEVRLTFSSTGRRKPRPMTIIENVAGQQKAATLPAISGDQTHELRYPLLTTRRGLVSAGPMVVRRSDPFNLVRAERRYGDVSTVSVRPRRYRLRMLPSGRQRDLEGPTRERSEGSSSFHQLRLYVPGDDLRRIHWKTSARTGELVVQQLVDTTRPEVVVVLDNRSAVITEEDFESAVEAAASVILAAENSGFPTMLVFVGDQNVVDLDGRPIPHLDRLTAVSRTDSGSLLELANATSGSGRSLVFLTGEIGAADFAALSRLARGFRLAYLVSIVEQRSAPMVAPPGMRSIACAGGPEFAAHWATL